ncbi:acyl-CoA dehydrogenase family protein [Patulibacter sp. NPDC049589]|uniref:acyl-CoA dehydrogenase family protein n=1 Tax=Patulibacter sp. NPDC049589 TaxID=3154731 RepID=UPI00344A3905
MRVTLTDEQEFLREAVHGTIERHAPLAAIRRWALNREGDDLSGLVGEQGWLGIGVAEDAGGEGGGVVERALVAEELGHGSVPDAPLWSATLAALVLAGAGDAAGAETALDPDAAVALLADARRPLDRPVAIDVAGGSATVDVDFVPLPGAPAAATTFVALVADDAGGFTVVRIPGAGATLTPRVLTDHTRPLYRVTLADAAVEEVGPLSAAQAERLTAEVAVLVAADALGAAQWLLDTTVAYVKERKQFGVAVGSFQAVKHYAAQMVVPIEATRAAVSYAAWALDEGEDDALLHAWIAKAYAADNLNDVADKALFLHGAIGYTWEHDLQLPFKRIRADARIGGSAASYHDRVAALAGLTTTPVTAG